MTVTERVLIVGYGYAGRRFATAFDHLRRIGADVEIVGFCDLDPARVPQGATAFGDLDRALTELSPTVICVTVNEAAHGAVFAALESYPRALILSEKPLAASTGEGERVANFLRHHVFSMNLVERFSPIVADCVDWLGAAGPVEVVRAEAFWGKSRIHDPRPTIGVLSELIHPLDLMRHVFGLGELKVVAAEGIASDFAVGSAALPESVDVHAVADGRTPFLLHSSFAWPARMRRVTGFVRSVAGSVFCVDLVFDTPHWDCDRLTISSISDTGWWSQVHGSSVTRDDLPADIKGVGKVVRFVEASLNAWRGRPAGQGLVDLDESVRLQRVLGEVESMTRDSTASIGYGGRHE